MGVGVESAILNEIRAGQKATQERLDRIVQLLEYLADRAHEQAGDRPS